MLLLCLWFWFCREGVNQRAIKQQAVFISGSISIFISFCLTDRVLFQALTFNVFASSPDGRKCLDPIHLR